MLNSYYSFMDKADIIAEQKEESLFCWVLGIFNKLGWYWREYTLLCFFLIFLMLVIAVLALALIILWRDSHNFCKVNGHQWSAHSLGTFCLRCGITKKEHYRRLRK